ncbi:hypothetical protein FRB99_008150, partial [Tulasnella sp. 403]
MDLKPPTASAIRCVYDIHMEDMHKANGLSSADALYDKTGEHIRLHEVAINALRKDIGTRANALRYQRNSHTLIPRLPPEIFGMVLCSAI